MDKKMRTTTRILPLALAGLVIASSAQFAGAQAIREADDALSARAFDAPELRVSSENAPLSDAPSFVSSDTDLAWQAFAAGKRAPWVAHVDKRSGRIDYAEGGNVAWIPGAGNSLTAADLGLAANGKVSLATLETLARRQLAEVGSMLGVDPAEPAFSMPAVPANPRPTSGSSTSMSSPAAAGSRARASSSTSTTAT